LSNSDFIITLSWPEGKISAVGSWYDKILGLNRKYSIGHTAIILINSITNEIYYLDFGRYHTPIGFGRVRDIETDPNLTIRNPVIIENNSINSVDKIIKEIYEKKSTHGEGRLYYKILDNINFRKGRKYAKLNQNRGLISFGPFSKNSLNCGRFVYNVMRKSNFSTIGTYKFIFNDFLLRIPILRNLSIKYYFKN
jgi:hypothetical protein